MHLKLISDVLMHGSLVKLSLFTLVEFEIELIFVSEAVLVCSFMYLVLISCKALAMFQVCHMLIYMSYQICVLYSFH